jgi:hypothetical protein
VYLIPRVNRAVPDWPKDFGPPSLRSGNSSGSGAGGMARGGGGAGVGRALQVLRGESLPAAGLLSGNPKITAVIKERVRLF